LFLQLFNPFSKEKVQSFHSFYRNRCFDRSVRVQNAGAAFILWGPTTSGPVCVGLCTFLKDLPGEGNLSDEFWIGRPHQSDHTSHMWRSKRSATAVSIGSPWCCNQYLLSGRQQVRFAAPATITGNRTLARKGRELSCAVN